MFTLKLLLKRSCWTFIFMALALPVSARVCFLPDSTDCGEGDVNVPDVQVTCATYGGYETPEACLAALKGEPAQTCILNSGCYYPKCAYDSERNCKRENPDKNCLSKDVEGVKCWYSQLKTCLEQGYKSKCDDDEDSGNAPSDVKALNGPCYICTPKKNCNQLPGEYYGPKDTCPQYHDREDAGISAKDGKCSVCKPQACTTINTAYKNAANQNTCGSDKEAKKVEGTDSAADGPCYTCEDKPIDKCDAAQEKYSTWDECIKDLPDGKKCVYPGNIYGDENCYSRINGSFTIKYAENTKKESTYCFGYKMPNGTLSYKVSLQDKNGNTVKDSNGNINSDLTEGRYYYSTGGGQTYIPGTYKLVFTGQSTGGNLKFYKMTIKSSSGKSTEVNLSSCDVKTSAATTKKCTVFQDYTFEDGKTYEITVTMDNSHDCAEICNSELDQFATLSACQSGLPSNRICITPSQSSYAGYNKNCFNRIDGFIIKYKDGPGKVARCRKSHDGGTAEDSSVKVKLHDVHNNYVIIQDIYGHKHDDLTNSYECGHGQIKECSETSYIYDKKHYGSGNLFNIVLNKTGTMFKWTKIKIGSDQEITLGTTTCPNSTNNCNISYHLESGKTYEVEVSIKPNNGYECVDTTGLMIR